MRSSGNTAVRGVGSFWEDDGGDWFDSGDSFSDSDWADWEDEFWGDGGDFDSGGIFDTDLSLGGDDGGGFDFGNIGIGDFGGDLGGGGIFDTDLSLGGSDGGGFDFGGGGIFDTDLTLGGYTDSDIGGGFFDTDLTLGGHDMPGGGLWDNFGGNIFDGGGDLITRETDSGGGDGQGWQFLGSLVGGFLNVAAQTDLFGLLRKDDDSSGGSSTRPPGSSGGNTNTGGPGGNQTGTGSNAGGLNNPNTSILLVGFAALLIATRK